MAPLYRQRAVTVEAMRFDTPADAEKIIEWVNLALGADRARWRKDGILILQDPGTTNLYIQMGDYVIREGDRRFGVCNNINFRNTYEPVVAR